MDTETKSSVLIDSLCVMGHALFIQLWLCIQVMFYCCLCAAFWRI